MKSKFSVILVIVALVGILVALDYRDAEALVVAYSSSTDSACTRCLCKCVCPPGGYDWEYQFNSGNYSQVYCPCVVSVAPTCTIYAHARAYMAPNTDGPWEAVVADTMYVSRECQEGMGKGGEGLIRIHDSLHVVASIVGNVVAIHVAGHWSICDYTDETVLGEYGVWMQRPGYPLWGGDIHFVPSSSTNWQDHVVVSGFSVHGNGPWTLDDFTGGIDGNNCLWVHIDTTYNVPYMEHDTPTQLFVTGWKRHVSTPSSSESDRIILILALISTGIGLIWWRKRRRAVAIA